MKLSSFIFMSISSLLLSAEYICIYLQRKGLGYSVFPFDVSLTLWFSFSLNRIFVLCVWLFGLNICVYILSVCCDPIRSLGMQLLNMFTHHISARNWTRVQKHQELLTNELLFQLLILFCESKHKLVKRKQSLF